MLLNMCPQNSSYASEDTIFFSIYVDQTHPMPSMALNASQMYLTKHILCRRGQEMYLNMS
jgi:hypothetical protein